MRAAGGDRRSYRPLGNARFPSAEPADVVRRLLERLERPAFYIADLDAITGGGDNAAQIRKIAREFPALDLWLDCGVRDRVDFERLRRAHPAATVITATETLADAQLPGALRSAREHFILSLDFDAGGLLGDAALLERTEDWPDTVIALSLFAVGTAAGPDLAAVSALREKCAGRRLIAGGGVRDENDLAQLERAGADAALVANALYAGVIPKADEPSV